MGLRYLAGEDEDMIEKEKKDIIKAVVEEDEETEEVVEGEIVEEDEISPAEEISSQFKESLVELNTDTIDDIAIATASVVMKQISDYEDLPEEVQRFLYEQTQDGIAFGLETADYSKGSFELWYEHDMLGVS